MKSLTANGKSDKPFISVIIPFYNSEATLPLCLAHLTRSGYLSYEILAVDDCSCDNSREVAQACPRVRLIRQPRNSGAASARNRGAEEARGDILLFMDSDILVEPDSLFKVVKCLENSRIDGVVGLLGPRMQFHNFSSNYKNLYMHYTYSILPYRVAVFYSSFAAIRREVFQQMGGFDGRYKRATIEDIEVGQRIVGQGYELVMPKDLQVEHLRYYSFRGLLKTGCSRAAGIAKIRLRQNFRCKAISTYQTSPASFRFGIVLSFLLAFSLLTWLIQPEIRLFILALFFYLVLIMFNWRFLVFLGRARGTGFFFRSCLAMPLDMFSHGLGVIHGVASYARGNKF